MAAQASMRVPEPASEAIGPQQAAQPEVVLEVRNLVKHFPLRKGLIWSLTGKPAPAVRAVDGISFRIGKGEIFGLVGESGCGKTTTGRLVLRLLEPTSGEVIFEGTSITRLPDEQMRLLRRRMQVVFQDPYESMNPRMDLLHIISEPLRIQGLVKNVQEAEEAVVKALEDVQLTPAEEYLYRFPHELSGGQRQRAAVARALVLNPDFIVADEPVSMLDVSIRGEILNLMLSLSRRRGVSFLYITHDLALARHVCDRIAVMYLGEIVEQGTVEQVVLGARHPYTQALIGAVLQPKPSDNGIRAPLAGEVPNPANPPSGCRLHPRCPIAKDMCKVQAPPLTDRGDGHELACHFR